jgi:hypothetical protein
MGFPADHYLCVPHNYQYLEDSHFNELLDQLAQDIATLVGALA